MPGITINALPKKEQTRLMELADLLGCSLEEAASRALAAELDERLTMDFDRTNIVIPFPSKKTAP